MMDTDLILIYKDAIEYSSNKYDRSMNRLNDRVKNPTRSALYSDSFEHIPRN